MLAAEYHAMAAIEQQHWWYRSLHDRVTLRLAREARRLGRPLDVLDAGCGTGGLLLALRDRSFIASSHGCDRDPLALAYCRERGLPVEAASVNELNCLAQRYDAVLSIDVLYHRAVDPARALAGMAGLLRPGGLLVLNVAAMPCLQRRHDDRVMGARRFLPQPLRQLVEAAGLGIEELGYWNSWLTPLLLVQIWAERLGRAQPELGGPAASDLHPPPGWINALLLRLLRWEARITNHLPLPFGSSLLLQARHCGFS